ncbi:hypothetical protein [Novosphingobium sp. KACC 22771]|uniref:hypothetical protein n=1 Tax=Novosphingobium sp. KACC 22771 TaxID=3025670 RepID=UPI0023656464|nr:hypothetical protein [Novosphingobium sp. KACC 22771]WDF72448.1 hypothetical protein PQ467_16945 [Novosphingobium sp. KACC 22771]
MASLVLMFIKTKKAGDRMGQSRRIAGEKIPDDTVLQLYAVIAMMFIRFFGPAARMDHWCKARVKHDRNCCC